MITDPQPRAEARRREYYAVLTRESERLTRLIDNVLDFSRIEGGRQRYDIAPGGVEPIVHEVVEAFRYPLAQQGFKVDVEIAPDLPDVPLDAPAMKQALANLKQARADYRKPRDAVVELLKAGRTEEAKDRGERGRRGERAPAPAGGARRWL